MILILLVGLTLSVVTLPTHPTHAGEVNAKLFSGKPVLVVVNGYSTSYHWPAMLQRKLDRYHEGKRVVEVVSTLQGGTPIAKWMDADTGAPKGPWTNKLVPALKAKGDRQAVVLCQQSLQWALGADRTKGIDSQEDAAAIARGAEVIGRYVDRIKDDGADEVVIAMHIYKHPMEPQIGNERLALAAYLASQPAQVWAGPDVWAPTKAGYPELFAGDKVHPNSVGAELMAHLWFEALLKREGLRVPAWSKEEYKAAQKAGPVNLPRGAGGRAGGGNRPQNAAPNNRGGATRVAPAVLRRYDKDGDGKLNAAEQAAFEEAKKARAGNR
jgi:hypothetical protein